jgi:uncharacterized protein
MLCAGVVTNVTNFGAFVDIGVHQDGLVHISQLSDSFVKDPRAVVNPGDKVQVRVVEVDLEKRQIALTMKKNADISASKPSGSNLSSGASKNNSRPRSDASGQRRPQSSPHQPETIGNNPFANLGAMLSGPKR